MVDANEFGTERKKEVGNLDTALEQLPKQQRKKVVDNSKRCNLSE